MTNRGYNLSPETLLLNQKAAGGAPAAERQKHNRIIYLSVQEARSKKAIQPIWFRTWFSSLLSGKKSTYTQSLSPAIHSVKLQILLCIPS